MLFDQELGEENGSEKAEYKVETGELMLWIPKKNSGETFTSLDLLARLLRKPSESSCAIADGSTAGPRIEILASSCEEIPSSNEIGEIDWSLPQKLNESHEPVWSFFAQIIREESPQVLSKDGPFYGFNNSYSRVFCGYESGELCEMVMLPDPDATRESERRALRINAENAKFDAGQYL